MCNMKEFFGQHDVDKQHNRFQSFDGCDSQKQLNNEFFQFLLYTVHFDKTVQES